MLKPLTDKFKAIKNSPQTLDYSIRAFKGLTLLCAGGVGLWGGLTLGGLALVGLKAAGLGIPAIVGDAAIGTGVLMCLKSVVFNRVFSYTHRTLEKVKARRSATSPNISPAQPQPVETAKPPRFAKLAVRFNGVATGMKTAIGKITALPSVRGDKPPQP